MTKSCVVTASFACPPMKVWLYLTNPNLNSWRTDLSEAVISDDGMQVTEKNKDGSTTQITFSDKEKARRMSCTFVNGRVKGSFTAILLGGGDSTSLECTMQLEGVGLFTKPQKLLESRIEMLRKVLGA